MREYQVFLQELDTMADINIERKEASVWSWVVGQLRQAVVVFVVLQYIKGRGDSDPDSPADSTTVQQYQPAPPPPPATPDSLTGDTIRNDTVPGVTSSSL